MLSGTPFILGLLPNVDCIPPTSIRLTVFLGNGLTKSISKIFAPNFLAITFAASFVFPDNVHSWLLLTYVIVLILRY